MCLFLSECTQQFAALQTATDEYIECENQASELQAASDYLAEQVRLFVVTGQREYMDLYFEEKDVTRRQEKGVRLFGTGNLTEQRRWNH